MCEPPMWEMHEVWDGTYTFSDLLDAHEILAIKNENRHREREYAELQKELRNK